jgi:hypothetical protein
MSSGEWCARGQGQRVLILAPAVSSRYLNPRAQSTSPVVGHRNKTVPKTGTVFRVESGSQKCVDRLSGFNFRGPDSSSQNGTHFGSVFCIARFPTLAPATAQNQTQSVSGCLMYISQRSFPEISAPLFLDVNPVRRFCGGGFVCVVVRSGQFMGNQVGQCAPC